MLSTRLLAKYPFFADFSEVHQISLAAHAEEVEFHDGEVLFRPEDELDCLYLLQSGQVGIFLNAAADGEVRDGFGAMEPRIVHRLHPGDVFSWSAFMPPHEATAGAMALGTVRCIRLAAPSLLRRFQKEPEFGYHMMQKLARVIHDRLYQRRREDAESGRALAGDQSDG